MDYSSQRFLCAIYFSAYESVIHLAYQQANVKLKISCKGSTIFVAQQLVSFHDI